ncbi:MAG: hypothetical protein M0R73_07655 [Dehalococcoidia bacterium]|nr:hypothetical protein [Dehalococcoidia bacterium]
MALIRKMAGLGTAMALAAVLFGAFAASASAQANPPFTAYGTGLTAGDTISASIDGEACGEATVDAEGNWLLPIASDHECAPQVGDTINFAINGEAAAETATYSFGGAPEDVANGIDLTVADGGDDDNGETPAPAPTGNAGLLGSTGTSMALVLALGVFAAAMVAGGRTATRRN